MAVLDDACRLGGENGAATVRTLARAYGVDARATPPGKELLEKGGLCGAVRAAVTGRMLVDSSYTDPAYASLDGDPLSPAAAEALAEAQALVAAEPLVRLLLVSSNVDWNALHMDPRYVAALNRSVMRHTLINLSTLVKDLLEARDYVHARGGGRGEDELEEAVVALNIVERRLRGWLVLPHPQQALRKYDDA